MILALCQCMKPLESNKPVPLLVAYMAIGEGMKQAEQIGPYILKKRIATGGMADLFLAEKQGPIGFHKEVVIKRVHKMLLREAETQLMFIDEAKIHSQLSHPNIVQLFDLAQDQDSFMMVLEYVRGFNLHGLIEDFRSLPQADRAAYSLQIVCDVLSALDYAHNLQDNKQRPLGLIHRDISPANILISEAGIAKLCDFGVAKSALQQILTGTGITKGKLRYMAPEQLDGRMLDHRTDLFAVGVCLYELLTTQTLILGDHDDALVRSIRSGAYLSRLSQLKDMNEDIHTLLQKALQPSPSRRFSSAHEFWYAAKNVLTALEWQHGPRRLQDFLQDRDQNCPIGSAKSRSAQTDANIRQRTNTSPKPQASMPKLWSRMLSTCLLAPFSAVALAASFPEKLIPRFFRRQRTLDIQP